jgi:hypothetical protein
MSAWLLANHHPPFVITRPAGPAAPFHSLHAGVELNRIIRDLHHRKSLDEPCPIRPTTTNTSTTIAHDPILPHHHQDPEQKQWRPELLPVLSPPQLAGCRASTS